MSLLEVENLNVCFESEGKLLASFSYIPYRLAYHDKEMLVAVGVDTAVSPSARTDMEGIVISGEQADTKR